MLQDALHSSMSKVKYFGGSSFDLRQRYVDAVLFYDCEIVICRTKLVHGKFGIKPSQQLQQMVLLEFQINALRVSSVFIVFLSSFLTCKYHVSLTWNLDQLTKCRL